jgi:hypothetical protein
MGFKNRRVQQEGQQDAGRSGSASPNRMEWRSSQEVYLQEHMPQFAHGVCVGIFFLVSFDVLQKQYVYGLTATCSYVWSMLPTWQGGTRTEFERLSSCPSRRATISHQANRPYCPGKSDLSSHPMILLVHATQMLQVTNQLVELRATVFSPTVVPLTFSLALANPQVQHNMHCILCLCTYSWVCTLKCVSAAASVDSVKSPHLAQSEASSLRHCQIHSTNDECPIHRYVNNYK